MRTKNIQTYILEIMALVLRNRHGNRLYYFHHNGGSQFALAGHSFKLDHVRWFTCTAYNFWKLLAF